MTGSQGWSPSALTAALQHVAAEVIAAAPTLSKLDGVAGDGDLGVTLTIGFGQVAEKLGEAAAADAGQVLVLTGTTLATSAPSTFGTLLGMALRTAGRAITPAPDLDAATFARVLRSLAGSVAERGQVTAGQRTMLDALLPARDAAERAAEQGAGLAGTVDAAASAAGEGAAATAGMHPQAGRAGWVGDRVVGSPDAGATAVAVILRALSDSASPLA